MSLIQTFKNTNPRLRILPLGIFLMSLAIGIITRFWWNIEAYNAFLGEQVRDGEMMLGIWNKQYPRFGPVSSIGGYGIPPLYLYIGAIFAGFGTDPVFQVVSNMITSFGSIILFGLIVFRTLNKIDNKNRLLLASLASLMWSLFAVDIFFSGFEWNPNSVTFWLMVFVINLDNLFNYWNSKKSLILGWIWQGIVLGILVSLHSSTLFMMPIVLGIYSIYWGIKKKSYYCLVGWLSFALSLWIYIREEFRTGFRNSFAILNTITGSSTGVKRGILERIYKIGDTIWNIPNFLYFPNTNSNWVFGGVFVMIMILGFIVHSGKRFYIWFYILILGIYCLATSNYFGPYYMHYYAMVWAIGPLFLFLCIGSLGLKYLESTTPKFLVISSVLVATGFVLLFGYYNYLGISNINSNKYSNQRNLTVDDMRLILTKLPPNTVVCAGGNSNALKYLDKYESQKSRTIVDRCEDRIQYMVIGKYGFNDFRKATLVDLEKRDSIYSDIVFENNQFIIYKQKTPRNDK